ncbi:hypothetical protein G3A_13750 [Bacillus sp. 17376]|uniref:Uncharacterized protein n=1 Tax=Mesobacillus boroniphilus JCM 21738 TaxID=1294265 RepID=W4RN51_9BACI|nr:hypothetical protein [Mesobacillus boroniphilus]ESU31965.1 hypothetical protein G3A_13750 [Bacillus sp. 17376]GAE45552.1 hypothetical protein JCM21738_2371 [Mesobacillus boroniphilus JCM 21738]
MFKKGMLLIVCCIPIITACTDTEIVNQLESEKETLTMDLAENKAEIDRLNEKISEMEGQLETNQKENDLFSQMSYLSMEFVKAHTTGDKETLQALLSEELIMEERDNNLFVKNNDNVEWLLYSADNHQLDDWVIQGFQYNPENDTYTVHIREFFSDANGEPVSPPTFLNLKFKLYNDQWKVDGLEFDV